MRRVATLVGVCLALGACPTNAPVESLRGRAEALRPQDRVSVQGLLEAALLQSSDPTSAARMGRSSPPHKLLVQSLWRATRLADAGQLSPEDVELLRTRVAPLIGRIALAKVTAETFQPWCEAAAPEGDAFVHVVRAATSGRGGLVPERWEGDTDAGYRDLFETPRQEHDALVRRADCPETQFALGIASESILQALANLLTMRAVLLDGELANIAAAPDAYASWLVANFLPASLSNRFGFGTELRLQEIARALPGSVDQAMAAQVREQTVGAIRTIEDQLSREATQAHEDFGDDAFGSPGQFGRWCRRRLREEAAGNVLLATESTVRNICQSDAARYDLVGTWIPTSQDLPVIVDELGASVSAYLDKVGSAWDERNFPRTIKKVIHNNIAGLGAFLQSTPECVPAACDWLGAAQADRDSAAFWEGVIFWGSVAVATVAIATGVGAIAVGALGFAASAAWLTSASVLVGYVGLGVSILSAAYLGTQGALALGTARRDLQALIVSGADPRQIQAEYDHAVELIEGALIDGVLALGEVAVLVRGVRAARRAGQGPVGALEEALEARRQEQAAARAAAAATGSADRVVDAARITAVGRRVALVVGREVTDEPEGLDLLRALLGGDRRALERIGVSGELGFDPSTVEWALARDVDGRWSILLGNADSVRPPSGMAIRAHTHSPNGLPAEIGPSGPLDRMLNAEQGRLGNHGLDGGLDFFPSEADVLDALHSGAGESRVLLGYRYAGVQEGQRIVADATAGGSGRPMHWVMDEIADRGIDSAVLHDAQNVSARLTLMADDEIVWRAVVQSTKSLDTTGPDAGLGFTQILEVLVP